jgi:hypothetical protein
MNVACAVPQSREDREVDEIDNRAAVHHLVKIGDRPFIDRLVLRDHHVAFFDRGEEGVHGDFRGKVLLLKLLEIVFQNQNGVNRASGQSGQAVERRDRLGLDHGDRHFVPHAKHRQCREPFRLVLRDAPGDLRVDQAVAQHATLHIQA